MCIINSMTVLSIIGQYLGLLGQAMCQKDKFVLNFDHHWIDMKLC